MLRLGSSYGYMVADKRLRRRLWSVNRLVVFLQFTTNCLWVSHQDLCPLRGVRLFDDAVFQEALNFGTDKPFILVRLRVRLGDSGFAVR